jgi:2-C-methyl-D-erythritol 4-phosphate cytidylyltransferase/2-C-methyl-D-erythritol 2,4-cyclodiphosphate synthase
MTVGAIVPAAGSGTRFGSSHSKLNVSIAGRTVLQWSVHALSQHPAIRDIVVVVRADESDAVRAALSGEPRVTAVVEGGPTRCASVRRGLEAMREDVDVVLVHDAARPALAAGTVDAVLDGVRRWGAAVPGVPVSDTVKRTDAEGVVTETVSRDSLYAVQTPQGALRSALESAYRRLADGDEPPTDEAGLLERSGMRVGVVPGDPNNVKLTSREDLPRLEQILESRTDGSSRTDEPMWRTGIGYDVHRLVLGLPLWLGGVQIQHSHGLAGHSDADVVMHAVCDALLGAVGAPDIGTLFPNSDARNRGRASREFVEAAAAQVRAHGYEIGNIDIAVQAEQPKLAPHREAMRCEIARAAGIGEDRIGLKATTNEGLGYVGRGEGIGCWAVAGVYRVRNVCVEGETE